MLCCALCRDLLVGNRKQGSEVLMSKSDDLYTRVPRHVCRACVRHWAAGLIGSSERRHMSSAGCQHVQKA